MANITHIDVIKSVYLRSVIKTVALDYVIKQSLGMTLAKIIFKVITLQKYYPIHLGSMYIIKFSKRDIFILYRKKSKMYFLKCKGN